jgi:hypothetical protein
MKQRFLGLSFFVAVAAVVHVTGCGPSDVNGTPLDGHYEPAAAPTTAAQQQGGGNCNSDATSLPKVDPSTLPACSPTCGGAHCVPSGNVPSSVQAQLATCSGGFCVPDSMISSGGAAPPSCKSLNNADGVCLSVCVPQVAQYKDIMPQSTCNADERCAPCINPLNNMPSGACDIGKAVDTSQCTQPPSAQQNNNGNSGGSNTMQCPHQGAPVIDPTTLPACGGPNSEAHCMDAKLVPSSMAGQLATCPTGYCVPDKLIASGGQFIPKTCTSVDGAEGRCTNTVIPRIAQEASMLPQDVCDSAERCAPCYDPLTGADSGACRISCDPGPTKPAVTFAKCCGSGNNTKGRCVPTSSVPASEAKQLKTDTCMKGTESCVPNDLLDPSFKPQQCQASGFLTGDYTGVCLSNCLDFGFAGITLAQGNCDGDHTCAPCTNPLTGQPSGAPGCM